MDTMRHIKGLAVKAERLAKELETGAHGEEDSFNLQKSAELRTVAATLRKVLALEDDKRALIDFVEAISVYGVGEVDSDVHWDDVLVDPADPTTLN